MRHRSAIVGVMLWAMSGALAPAVCSAADEGWRTVGVRAGISLTDKHEYFHQYEAFTQYGLPWHWRGESGWGLSTQLNLSAGMLHGGHANGFVGSLGPGITFDKNGRGVGFEVGPDFVVVSRDTFGTQDFGGRALFQGHASVSYTFDNGFGIAYRVQHTSNAGLYNGSNPGYDLQMAEIHWHFK